MQNQLTIFDIMYPKYKITKPIRLIELFSGYGSQALALKYLGVPFEHWRTCEWAIKSIQAYKDIHYLIDCDFTNSLNKEQIANYLFDKGISSNYNEPMTKQQILRLSEKQLRDTYNNIQITNNLVNIQQVKGKDLEIEDTDKYEYIMTYSFPCQDLSLAGKGKGMSDTSTRSGMLWEVERILTECNELGNLPQVLLMENVPQVHSEDNKQDFFKWQLRLEELGYKNYVQDLIATDYGIPQTRNRCFMVSILGDYSYKFPQPTPLKLKLKDMLEDNVDERYYLSDKMLDYCYGVNQKESKFPRGERFLQSLEQTNEKNIATTITTNAGNRPTDNFICNKSLKETLKQNKIKDTCYIDTYNKRIDEEKTGTITTGVSFRNNTFLAIKNATAKGYLEATDGDGIDISSRMEHHRGNVQKDKIQTLTTSGGNDRGVVIGTYQYSKSDNFMKGKDRLQLGKETSDTLQTTPKEGVVTIGNYSPSNHNASRIVDQEYSAPTVMENHGTITAIVDKPKVLGGYGKIGTTGQYHQQNRIYDDKVAISVTTAFNPYYQNNLRIRKLTPKECFRLMGVKDEDYEKCAKNQSDSSLYHLAGDSIVVNVLMAIFKELL